MAIKEIKSSGKPTTSSKPPEAAVPPTSNGLQTENLKAKPDDEAAVQPSETRDAILDGFESNQPDAAEIEANEEANAELNQPKTEAPEEEAHSHKPTFGEAAEKPEKTEPEGDPTIGPESLTAQETLDKRVEEQANQLNPDQVQEDGHWPSTEGLLAAPKSRPHTIDPATGHVIYAGEAASAGSGQVSGEGMAE